MRRVAGRRCGVGLREGGGLPHSNWEVGSCDEGAGREAGDSAGDARGLGQVAGSRQLQLQPKSKGH